MQNTSEQLRQSVIKFVRSGFSVEDKNQEAAFLFQQHIRQEIDSKEFQDQYNACQK